MAYIYIAIMRNKVRYKILCECTFLYDKIHYI